jgi:uncharacterized membrane protein YecN with MAPEG domain
VISLLLEWYGAYCLLIFVGGIVCFLAHCLHQSGLEEDREAERDLERWERR